MVMSSRTRRAVVAASTAVTLVSGVATPVHASETQRAYAAHTAACIGLFFSDQVAHAAQCLPNLSSTPWVDGTSGSALPVAPPPPPAVVNPPNSSYPQVGSSFG